MVQNKAILTMADGNSLDGGVNCRGMKKNRDCRQKSRYISEIIQDRAIVIVKCE